MAQKYGSVQIEWTPEKTEKVEKELMEFFSRYKLYSGESLEQSDNGNTYSPVVMGNIADILFGDIEIDYE